MEQSEIRDISYSSIIRLIIGTDADPRLGMLEPDDISYLVAFLSERWFMAEGHAIGVAHSNDRGHIVRSLTEHLRRQQAELDAREAAR